MIQGTSILLLLLCLVAEVSRAKDRPEFCSFPYHCPTAGRLYPQVAQRGTEVTVLLQGGRLEEIQEVLFYREGISFVDHQVVETAVLPPSNESRAVHQGNVVRLTLGITEDCQLGQHRFRVRTRETLSEPVSIWITPFPCLAEKGGDNDSFETAQVITTGTSVYGYHPPYAATDHDFYAIELERDQRLTVESWASCLGFDQFGGHNDPAITVYGPDRSRIAFSDDTSLRDLDPYLTMVAPKSGTYYINFHPNMETEKGLRHYVIHVGQGRRPAICYPLGGKTGTELTTQLIGDPIGDYTITIPLPKEPGKFEESITDFHPEGTVLPLHLQTSSFDNVLEDGADHFSPETAQVHSGALPIAFNGRIEHEGKTDWYRFRAKKGERYRVRTYASSLGSSLDGKLLIRPAGGTKSRIDIEVDDSRWIDRDWWGNDRVWPTREQMDPITLFEADADGDYVVGIADARRLYGPEFVYRIEFQPAVDQSFLYFPADYRESPYKWERIVVHRGNTIERKFTIIHGLSSTYRGGIEVVARGLPDGVTFSCPILHPGQTTAQGIFTAGPQARPWCGLIDLELRPTEPDSDFKGSFVQVLPLHSGRGGYTSFTHRARKCPLAVVEPAPFRVRVAQPTIGLARNAVIDLEVEVERDEGFDEAISLFAQWKPDGVSTPPPLLIPRGENKGIYRLNASSSAQEGIYPFTLTAQQENGGDRSSGTGFHFVASPPIQLQITDPFITIRFSRTAIERQKEGEIVGEITTLRPLPVEATANLIRLPVGIEPIKSVSIDPGQTSVRFPIRATRDALLGHYQEIGCEITVRQEGQVITQQTGNATLRIDEERTPKAGLSTGGVDQE